MKVRWTPAAVADLGRHLAFVARENEPAAWQVHEATRKRADQLIDWPESGPKGRRAGTRELVETRYRHTLVYWINKDAGAVEILRVIGPGEDWSAA
ncbi:MAG TPA: type II toxin-antitoxin system RelE/ParE family toxin [Gammaproteobacteria bacterium]|nr:type II toxin-antitoxin system RelE/ParE family toxin [Gammaproteobacteria bacterium]